MSSAGKGERRRAGDNAAFRANHARIFGADKRTGYGGLYVYRDGGLVRVPKGTHKKQDSKNFVSNALGCNPKQVPDFNRRFEHTGVTWNPVTGKAQIPDRPAKLHLMKIRGMHDHEEVRG